MQVTDKKIVIIDFVMKDDEGTIIEAFNEGNFGYLHGANNILPGLERALTGKSKGDQISVTLSPEEAYGEIDTQQIQQVPRSMFPQDQAIAEGMQFHAQTPEGQPIIVTVVNVEDEHIVIDGNHPLAGITIHCDATVVDVREPTELELNHGHYHEAGSCNN